LLAKFHFRESFVLGVNLYAVQAFGRL